MKVLQKIHIMISDIKQESQEPPQKKLKLVIVKNKNNKSTQGNYLNFYDFFTYTPVQLIDTIHSTNTYCLELDRQKNMH